MGEEEAKTQETTEVEADGTDEESKDAAAETPAEEASDEDE